MAYDVDFWYLSQDACQISTDFTPFSEHQEESIYMKTSDFFKMVEKFTDPDLERKAKAFDEIVIETTGAIMNCPPGAVETEAGRITLDIIEKYDLEDDLDGV